MPETPPKALPPGWTMRIKFQNGFEVKRYVDPATGYEFYSRADVYRYLDATKHNTITSEQNEVDPVALQRENDTPAGAKSYLEEDESENYLTDESEEYESEKTYSTGESEEYESEKTYSTDTSEEYESEKTYSSDTGSELFSDEETVSEEEPTEQAVDKNPCENDTPEEAGESENYSTDSPCGDKLASDKEPVSEEQTNEEIPLTPPDFGEDEPDASQTEDSPNSINSTSLQKGKPR